jgi:hypothetical protein
LTKICDQIKGMEEIVFEGEAYAVKTQQRGGKKIQRVAKEI